MRVDCNRLDRQFFRYQQEYEQAALETLRSGRYVLGEQGRALEQEFAAFTGMPHCVGVNSGLDALTLALQALDIGAGDEVIVPANTYIASVLAITQVGAIPVFVEPDIYYNIDPERIVERITPQTKAVLVVHLYGQACRMRQIVRIVKEHDLLLIEDCAQSHGVYFDGQMTGTFGDAGCFSFFPTKNIGAFGDSGAVVTSSEQVAERLQMLRNYGSREKYVHELEGINSRMDEVQAALLRVKLRHFAELQKERAQIAQRYLTQLQNSAIRLPSIAPDCSHGWHLFVVRCLSRANRDGLATYLKQQKIETMIHYPIPPHLSECYNRLRYTRGDFPITEGYAETILTLPLYNCMTEEEQCYVVDSIEKWR